MKEQFYGVRRFLPLAEGEEAKIDSQRIWKRKQVWPNMIMWGWWP